MIKVQTVGSDSQLVPRFFKDFFTLEILDISLILKSISFGG